VDVHRAHLDSPAGRLMSQEGTLMSAADRGCP
jgi:hypothetical protein